MSPKPLSLTVLSSSCRQERVSLDVLLDVCVLSCLPKLMKLILIFPLTTRHGFDSEIKTIQIVIQDYKTIKQQFQLFGRVSLLSTEIVVVGIRVGQAKPFHGSSSLGGKICLARQNKKLNKTMRIKYN